MIPDFLSLPRFFTGGSPGGPVFRAFPPFVVGLAAHLALCGQQFHPRRQQGLQPGQVIDGKAEKRLAGEFGHALVAGLPQAAHGLDPAECLFNHLAALQAQGVALTPSRAAIDRAAARLPGHVGFDAQALKMAHEIRRVVALVRANRRPRLDGAADHALGRFSFGSTAGLGGFHINDEAVAVLEKLLGCASLHPVNLFRQ